jgi:hypothetical protein
MRPEPFGVSDSIRASSRAIAASRWNLRPPDCADITAVAVTDLTTAKIRRRKVLGGLIHEYERAA